MLPGQIISTGDMSTNSSPINRVTLSLFFEANVLVENAMKLDKEITLGQCLVLFIFLSIFNHFQN